MVHAQICGMVFKNAIIGYMECDFSTHLLKFSQSRLWMQLYRYKGTL